MGRLCRLNRYIHTSINNNRNKIMRTQYRSYIFKIYFTTYSEPPRAHTTYFINVANVVLQFVLSWLCYVFMVDLCDAFTHIIHGCFTCSLRKCEATALIWIKREIKTIIKYTVPRTVGIFHGILYFDKVIHTTAKGPVLHRQLWEYPTMPRLLW